jgi:5-oxoprolinase (ATP-hydrolysing)
MPPDSVHVDEEGVLLDNVQLVAAAVSEAEMRAIRFGRHPSRNVDQNLADLRAQVAACARVPRSREDGRAFRPAGRARMGHVQTTPRIGCARAMY